MSLLTGFRVVQIGKSLAAAVCGRLFADVGAEVICIDPDTSTPLAAYLNRGKKIGTLDAISNANLVVREDENIEVESTAAQIFISAFGRTGPKSDAPARDLTLLYSSGIARLLTGQVDDLNEAPIRPVGEQSAFIGGLAAACAGMHAAQTHMRDAIIDVSIEEALATMAMTELASATLHGRARPRKRISDGNGATVCILPARDGFTAISPRENRQWAAWLEAMGSPTWGGDPRFVTKADRIANWDALHALMSEWSRQHSKQWIADTAQAARVPSFPLRELSEQLRSPQLEHREFWQAYDGTKMPGSPFGLRITPAKKLTSQGLLPLSGLRVLDFSWVIAGPTTTRYLAAMGADVIKVEAPGPGDPGRASELHTVLGQAKRAIVLDLKKPEAVQIARRLAEHCDVLVENFATGVMDRLGLGEAVLRQLNPGLIYVSASGLGRTGPESHAVAYGTLLQCYAGFAGLNRHPDIAPRVGFAWLDPMCGLMLAFIVAAAIWRRRMTGDATRVDFSMIEAMLWTLAQPLLATQSGNPPKPRGNQSDDYILHGAWRCAGDDAWISIAVANNAQRDKLNILLGDIPLEQWLLERSAQQAETLLLQAGVPAAALASSLDLVASQHLRARGFWDDGLPGLPWRASFGRKRGAAPKLGAATDEVLNEVLGLSTPEIDALRDSGIFG